MILRVAVDLLRPLWSPVYLAVGVALWAFIGFQAAYTAPFLVEHSGVVDGVLVALSGPNPETLVLGDLLPWLTLHLYLVFWLGRTLESRWLTMLDMLLPRIGSRWKWMGALFLVTTAACVIYTAAALLLVGLIVTLMQPLSLDAGVLSVAGAPTGAGVEWLAVLVVLLFGTMLGLALLQLVLTLVLRYASYAFLAVVMLCLIGWITFDNALVQQFLPSTQSMLLRHAPFSPHENFTLAWSLIYNVVWVAVLFCAGLWTVQRLDMVRDT